MKKFLFPILLFGATVTTGHALTCVPKTGNTPSGPNYLQYWRNTYLQCGGGGGESFHKCAKNVVVEGWDGNLHKCTVKGWETVDNIDDCTGTLDQIEQQYNGLSNVGTLYSNQPQNPGAAFVYYYYADEKNGYTAVKNACKYKFAKFNEEYEKCQTEGGDFLSWDDNDTVALCKQNTTTPTPQTSPETKKTTPKQYRDIACRDTGGDRYDSKNDKCICNTDEKHLKAITSEEGYSICQCIAGYKRDNATNEARGECIDAGDFETHKEFDSAQWRRDTEAAYKHERDNAQSWANKGITAGSTLLTGEGAMKAAQALAEQKADKKAEEQMAEWISKMGCEYGNGQQVNLGKEETLPAGDLAKYYAEYKQLADKLKATKTALNLRPGIETEVLYDRAETGLYQYANAERQSGGFTSLSRALMNPEGADAEQWNAQKAETNRDLWVGGALATVGLAGSYIANRAINKDHENKYKELEEKFRKIETKLLTTYPEIFKPTLEEPATVEIIKEEQEKEQPPIQPKTSKYAIDVFVDDIAFNPGHITLTPKAIEALESAAIEINKLPNNGASISNISIITIGYTDPDPIKTAQVNILTKEYTSALGKLPDSYGSKIDTNPELSQARAEMVLASITNNINTNLKQFLQSNAYGTTGKDCKEPKENYDKCRKVKIEITVQAEYAE